jgi:aspartyl/asparaginyl-tRNA synthetase
MISGHPLCCKQVFQKPLIVINYPKGIKAFYMKVSNRQLLRIRSVA